jgi:predicted nucleic acid-binding Zn ribbon protein
MARPAKQPISLMTVRPREKIMKKCPFCAEDIQDDAIKCKHCREFLDASTSARRADEKVTWYFKTSFAPDLVASANDVGMEDRTHHRNPGAQLDSVPSLIGIHPYSQGVLQADRRTMKSATSLTKGVY